MGRSANARSWHLSDKPTAPEFVAYWTNNGQRSELALDGSAANDPTRTSGLIRLPLAGNRSGNERKLNELQRRCHVNVIWLVFSFVARNLAERPYTRGTSVDA